MVATRVASAAAKAAAHRDPALPAPDPPDRRCQLCAEDESDSRRHLLVHCGALHNVRSYMELELQERVYERNHRCQLRMAGIKCNYKHALERFILGELNCANAVQQTGYNISDLLA